MFIRVRAAGRTIDFTQTIHRRLSEWARFRGEVGLAARRSTPRALRLCAKLFAPDQSCARLAFPTDHDSLRTPKAVSNVQRGWRH